MNIKLNNYLSGSNKRNFYYKQEKKKKNTSSQEKNYKEDDLDINENNKITFLDTPSTLKTTEIKTRKNTNNDASLERLLQDDEHIHSIHIFLEDLIPKETDTYNEKKINDILKLIINATQQVNPIKVSETLMHICSKIGESPKLSKTNIHLLIKAITTITKKNEETSASIDTFISETIQKRFNTISKQGLLCFDRLLQNKTIIETMENKDYISILKKIKSEFNQLKTDTVAHVISTCKYLIKAAKVSKKQTIVTLIHSTIEELKIKHESNSMFKLELD